MFVNIYIWIISKRAGYPIKIQGFKDSSERKACENFVRDIGGVERILNTEVKINKKQTLGSLNTGTMASFFPTNWEKNQIS